MFSLLFLALSGGATLLAGPDVLVSRENDFAHVEMIVAAHPSDPKKLIAGSMFLGSGFGTVVYASTDGGITWTPSHPAEAIETDADPVVLYTPKGTALFLALPANPLVNAAGRRYMPIVLYRSEDGRTWQKPVLLGTEGGYDYPRIAADPRSGRIYVGAVVGEESNLDLFRSDDDGRTFKASVLAKATTEGIGLGTTGLAVLADGTLVHSYLEYPMGNLRDTVREKKHWVTVSRDGGETFSEPVFAGSQILPPDGARDRFRLLGHGSQMAAGGDRIHLSWTDSRTGRPQVVVSSSADQGRTWSEPRPVAGPLPEGAYSFQPSLAVNKDGVLGVSWLDTRNHPGTDLYDAWFSASLDGGATFLPAVRLSSASSDPLGTGNQRPSPGSMWDRRNKVIRVFFLNALNRYPHGGDYAGLAAAADGSFHPLWPDSRTGTFQAWTTRVTLAGQPASATAPEAAVDLSESVELTFDPAAWDGETKELRLPIRLRNRSDKAIRGPLQVRVKEFGSGQHGEFLENTPAILNAANGEKGVGAVFDYSQAFGDFDVLEPGAVTDPVVWRFKIVGAGAWTPDMHVVVTGRVP
ncbi:MAG TPA: sialidase family protein [Thermoanaerobaculia bacterium]|nr:sialidase family protein [Thermoanaerobaculia bacterium]